MPHMVDETLILNACQTWAIMRARTSLYQLSFQTRWWIGRHLNSSVICTCLPQQPCVSPFNKQADENIRIHMHDPLGTRQARGAPRLPFYRKLSISNHRSHQTHLAFVNLLPAPRSRHLRAVYSEHYQIHRVAGSLGNAQTGTLEVRLKHTPRSACATNGANVLQAAVYVVLRASRLATFLLTIQYLLNILRKTCQV